MVVSSGIADPYWYEWYVGLEQVIRMLNSDNNISCVIFQKGDYSTIDDIVVKYCNGRQEYCYQVKHEIETSSRRNLTFNRLLTKDQDRESAGISLVDSLAIGWDQASRNTGNEIIPVLYTNRGLGSNRTQRTFNGTSYTALPLGTFFIEIKQKLENADGIDDIDFSDEERDLQIQWNEFQSAISIPDDIAISFLKKLSIKGDQSSLNDLRNSLISQISEVFGCSQEVAEKLFNRLVAELPKWTTSTRVSEEVTVEIVYEALSTNLEISNEQHRLAPPYPFFNSRVEFTQRIVNEFKQDPHSVVFISGEPGSGKTSIVSHIQAAHDFFTIRFHAFRPISPEQHFYNADAGLCEPRALWTELMVQIRSKLRGKLYRYSVPVCCDYCSDSRLRSEILRLLGAIRDETGETVYVCIDGLDHAARSDLPITFLSSLFRPSEMPAGICFVIVGQPATLYGNYPSWLSDGSTEIKRIVVPSLIKEDIEQLVAESIPKFSDEASRISELVYSLTKGNNLSVVYAVESIKKCTSYEELFELLASGEICEDVTQYYEHIWKHVVDTIIRKNVTENFAEGKVADAILLLNGRIYTRLLHEALNDISLSISEWDQLMDMLYPLIIPTANEHEYNVFHNDFRVFLMGVGRKYSSIFKSLAFQIAKYLHQSNWGIIKYKNEIPLLLCAEKPELVPDYFDVSYVINALAEGLSYNELHKFADIAYSEAVKAQQLDKYHNVYLALTTLHQHRIYFEYYGRQYTERDFQDIISIDISEISTKKLIKNNINDYYDTLTRCQKLFEANTPEMINRALSLYELWFGSWNPVSFVQAVYPEQRYPDRSEYKVNINETLKLWGEVSAKLQVPKDCFLHRDAQELHKYELSAEMIYGDAYFTYYFNHELYEDAIESLGKVRVSIKCIIEKLDNILLCGKANLFIEIIDKIQKQEDDDLTFLLSSAIVLVADPLRRIDLNIIYSTNPIEHIYDDTSMNTVAYSYIVGTQNPYRDDFFIFKKAYDHIKVDDENRIYEREIDYLKLMVRVSALLGKYNSQLAQTPEVHIRADILHRQVHDFFNKPPTRSFDFIKAFKFLLYTILNTPAVERMLNFDELCDDLKHVLFSYQHLGMYYKTIILDFLLRHNRIDIVREYFLNLYGTEGELFYQQEDWANSHRHFLKYSSLVIPEITNQVSNRLKWDVVGYSGHEETALFIPLEFYKICAGRVPGLWETFGIRLNALSAIADISSNEYSHDIAGTISASAAACGIQSFWKLHHLNDDYHYNLYILHDQLKDLLTMAKTEQDITAIWILACGLLSWYNQSDRDELRTMFKACLDVATALNIHTFIDSVEKLTPAQFDMANHELHVIDYGSKVEKNEYYLKREITKKAIEHEFHTMSTDDILDSISSMGVRIGEWDDVNIAWREIISRDDMNHSTALRFLSSISPRLEGRQWKNTGCNYIISQLVELLGNEAFWYFANINGSCLTEYDYQTSTRNATYLFVLCSDNFVDDANCLLDAELKCQELWITGDGHIIYSITENSFTQNLLQPRNIAELSMNILIEQFALNNVHRNEIALPSIYSLCIHDPSLFSWIKSNWDLLVYEQKDAIVHVCERWACKATIGFEAIIDVLKAEYEKSNRLSEKLRLYMILIKHAYVLGDTSTAMTFHAAEDQYTLSRPTHHGPINKNKVPNGISVFLDINSKFTRGYDSGRDIISYIQANTNESIRHRQTENYFRSGDAILVRNPAMSNIDPVLYGEEKRGRWDHLPLSWKLQYFVDIDDAWITTMSPEVTYDDNWNIEKELEVCLKENNIGKAETISQILLYAGLNQNEELLGACLWYPVGHSNNGVVVVQIAKAILKGNLLSDNRIYKNIINYSMLSDSDDIFEHGAEDIDNVGICLVRSIVGSAQFYLGNCQIYPANFLREIFRWRPLFENPMAWVNEKEEHVLRFERIVYPNRDTVQQNYYRQPMLFRWLADKSQLSEQLIINGLDTRMVSDIKRFDQIMKFS